MREIVVGRDSREMNRLAADKFIEIAQKSVNDRGRFTVALSGGSTPTALYRMLASEPYRSQLDWKTVLFFFGDERNVSPDSDESNCRMANQDLLEPLNISKQNVFPWHTEPGDPIETAAEYERTITSHFESAPPVLDLILLGMGNDGHTASLFPGTAALDEQERIAMANPVPQLNTTRLTLTYPVINAARNAAFLVAGADKANMLARVLDGTADLHELPSRGVAPNHGKLWWFMDAAAAKKLSS
jgi:6-phosphogluconolactonase